MPGKTHWQLRTVSYCYDESLPPIIGNALREVGFPVELPRKGMKDEELIPEMGRRNQVWITKDNRSRTQHESLLKSANVSVVWVRGLAHEKRKRKSSIQRQVGMKDILRMLVNKLDEITDIIATANGPRYVLLYTTVSSRGKKESIERFTTLKEVHDRLAGV